MSLEKQAHHIGKRKTSVARVYFRPRLGETGQIRINGRAFEEYFTRFAHRAVVLQALEQTQTVGQYDISINVYGGGSSGQAGAIRHAFARTLQDIDMSYRPGLKKAGYIKRDPREVERKKYGQSGARKKFQFSKR